MRKIIIISTLVFIILINLLGTTYATLIINEENLQKSIDKYMSLDDESTKDNDSSIELDKANKKVILTSDGQSYLIDYDLSDKPKFSIDLYFNSTMTKEEVELEADKSSLLMIMFMLVTDAAGIDFEDSMMYMFSSLFENTSMTQKIEFTNAIQYAKTYYSYNENNTFTDDLFTWTYKEEVETQDEYKIKSTLVINNDKDFSIINGTSNTIVNEITNSLISSAQNAANNYKNALEKENEILSTTQNKVNKITNSINKLPQTGRFFNLKDGLNLISITAFILLIIFILADIKYKNINKK